ncbi:hypothetical protein P4E94_11555 [Pontiellaceae bacterium B12219]|nr:hypothetical protein [Pontiellaceae bacterium B12219]
MNFLYAADLKKRFTCYGHFYELAFMNGETAQCRSVLEIVDRSIAQGNPAAISQMIPDVVVIMMNPGSSRPKEDGHVDEVLTFPRVGTAFPKELVLTQPDNTQYQIMRVAVSRGWKHIRVLNLSDLRDPKSVKFIQKVNALQEIMGGHVHSMFCPERAEELSFSLQRKTPTPILLGWGQDPGLLPLVEQCLGRISGEPTVTVPSQVHPLLNAHPSPMMQDKKIQWLETILQQIKLSEQ